MNAAPINLLINNELANNLINSTHLLINEEITYEQYRNQITLFYQNVWNNHLVHLNDDITNAIVMRTRQYIYNTDNYENYFIQIANIFQNMPVNNVLGQVPEEIEMPEIEIPENEDFIQEEPVEDVANIIINMENTEYIQNQYIQNQYHIENYENIYPNTQQIDIQEIDAHETDIQYSIWNDIILLLQQSELINNELISAPEAHEEEVASEIPETSEAPELDDELIWENDEYIDPMAILTCEPISPETLGICPICYNQMVMANLTITRCGHCFHASCLNTAFERHGNCPCCRTQLLRSLDIYE